MSNEKITLDMSPMDMIMNMAEGNMGAANVLMEMLNDTEGFFNILYCDTLGIRGSKLYMLHNDCCGRNNDKFKRTLSMFRNGVFSEEDIQSNLNLVRAIPFIDDSIEIENVPNYDEEFGPTDENWDEYCEKNKTAFAEKMNIALENQKSRNRL